MAKSAAPAKAGHNEPPKIIIVKKIVGDGHGGHHGGAWKVAYADFVTAMMAFFLLMWLLGATDEKARKGIADYFAPTLIEFKQNSAGSNGLLGGSSLIDAENYPHAKGQTGTRALTVPVTATGGIEVGAGPDGAIRSAEETASQQRAFEALRAELTRRIKQDVQIRRLEKNVRYTPTRDGLQIDLIDDADFSMFASGTTALRPEAARLVDEIARSIRPLPNQATIRGHTDSMPYGDPLRMNNWMLSSGRAEATRRRLASGGIGDMRFDRIEGVADREPFVPEDSLDPRNRRVSITLLYRSGQRPRMAGGREPAPRAGTAPRQAATAPRISLPPRPAELSADDRPNARATRS
ncbi:chemotaxis protein MotB [Sphingomonas jejuensis]|uniref:Chemotaxis protein MotB n=1 Tax=Sphingomonas jejuensis TaxID=904715 RepID=A0ABX0XNF3_9SPHN|nr:flagellar motor protein MotB [Sphingomonas jejuensis]NJC34774.1 chemotaxis protein MotB [Sphingomonas jejuensis]